MRGKLLTDCRNSWSFCKTLENLKRQVIRQQRSFCMIDRHCALIFHLYAAIEEILTLTTIKRIK